MPNVDILQSNFSSGELSPSAYGRTDIARYPNTAKVLENVISKTLGGAAKRPGTEFIAEIKDSAERSRLIPYVIDRDSAYVLESGDSYLRVFKNDGTQVGSSGSPYEIATPYSLSQVQQIDYTQGEDFLFIFHESVYPQRVRTFGDAKWDISPAPFTTTPFLELGDYPAANLTLSANTVGTGRTMTADASVFMASDVDRAILHNAGIAVITGYTSATQVTVEVKVVFDSTSIPTGAWNLDSSPQTTLTPSAKDPVGAVITLTLSENGWRSSDVGKFIRINSGLVKITAYSSATGMSGEIVKELSATTGAPALSWTLESSMWGTTNGYPRTGTLHQQRLVVGGTKKNPLTVAGSKSGEPLDFTKGTDDDDSFTFTLDANRDSAGPIRHLVASRDLLVLTDGGEFSIRAGVEKPITPTNVQIKPESSHGTAQVKPIKVGKEALFIQRAGRRIRAMGYKYDEDGYKSPDLSTLADHLTEDTITSIAFQQEPDPVVWIVLKTGKLISLTLDREVDVIAWDRHDVGGGVESVTTVPAGDRDQVWMIVRRSINGSVVRYIERLNPDFYPVFGESDADPDALPVENAPTNWGYQLDCAVVQEDETGKETWDGLDHLEGETVHCIADGVYLGDFEVDSGEITLPRTAQRVHIGLLFLPTVTLLTPEIQLGTGTSQTNATSVFRIFARFLNTIGATINGDEVIPGRIIGPAQLDSRPQPFSGVKDTGGLGWEKGLAETTISQNAPLPFHLLSVARSITINK